MSCLKRSIGSLGFARVGLSSELPDGFLAFVTGDHCIRQLRFLVLELTKADAASGTPETGLIQYIDPDGGCFNDAAQRREANDGRIAKLLLKDPLPIGGSAWWALEPGSTGWWSRADLVEAVAGELPLPKVCDASPFQSK